MLFLSEFASFLFVMFVVFLIIMGYLYSINTTNINGSNHVKSVQDKQTNITSFEEEILFWKKQLELQPTSRDVLWKLSKLYSSNNDQKQAEEYSKQAHIVDPNFNFK